LSAGFGGERSPIRHCRAKGAAAGVNMTDHVRSHRGNTIAGAATAGLRLTWLGAAAVAAAFIGALAFGPQEAAAQCGFAGDSFTCTGTTGGSHTDTSGHSNVAATGNVGGQNVTGGLNLNVPNTNSSFSFDNNGTVTSSGGGVDALKLNATGGGDIGYVDTGHGVNPALNGSGSGDDGLHIVTTGSGNAYVGYTVNGVDANGHFLTATPNDAITGTIQGNSIGMLITTASGNVFIDSQASISGANNNGVNVTSASGDVTATFSAGTISAGGNQSNIFIHDTTTNGNLTLDTAGATLSGGSSVHDGVFDITAAAANVTVGVIGASGVGGAVGVNGVELVATGTLQITTTANDAIYATNNGLLGSTSTNFNSIVSPTLSSGFTAITGLAGVGALADVNTLVSATTDDGVNLTETGTANAAAIVEATGDIVTPGGHGIFVETDAASGTSGTAVGLNYGTIGGGVVAGKLTPTGANALEVEGLNGGSVIGGNGTTGVIYGDAGMFGSSAGGNVDLFNTGQVYATDTGMYATETGGVTHTSTTNSPPPALGPATNPPTVAGDFVYVSNGCNGPGYCGGATANGYLGFNPPGSTATAPNGTTTDTLPTWSVVTGPGFSYVPGDQGSSNLNIIGGVGIHADNSGAGDVWIENYAIANTSIAAGPTGDYAGSVIVSKGDGIDAVDTCTTDGTAGSPNCTTGGTGTITVRNDGGANSQGSSNFTMSVILSGATGISMSSDLGGMNAVNDGIIIATDHGIEADVVNSNSPGNVLITNGCDPLTGNCALIGQASTNPNATIFAQDHSAIYVDVEHSTDTGDVEVDNFGTIGALSNALSQWRTFYDSDSDFSDSTLGGIVSIGGSAVHIRDPGNNSTNTDTYVTVYNDGLMLGDGGRHDAVIDISTSNGGNGVWVYNGGDGVIGSSRNFLYWAEYAAELGFDGTEYAGFGGNYSFETATTATSGVNNFYAIYGLDPNGSFAAAAHDHVLTATGSPLVIDNEGTMIGRIDLHTSGTQLVTPSMESYFEPFVGESGSTVNNFFYNYGYWGNDGTSRFHGGSQDWLINDTNGWIQTAFDPQYGNGDTSNYTPDGATNDWHNYHTAWLGLNYVDNEGVISLANGDPGDRLYIAPGHNGSLTYSGGLVEGSEYYSGYMVFDAYLTGFGLDSGLPDPSLCSSATAACADLIRIDTGVSGTVANFTGQTLIDVNNVNPNGGGYTPTGIPIIYAETPGNTTGEVDTSLIKDGIFKLDPQQPGYTNAYGGGGAIQDGAFNYFLGERQGLDNVDNEAIVLVGLPSAEAYQSATLLTALTNIWQITASAYSNRMTDLRDNWLDNGWPPANQTKMGVWAVAVGNWTSRDPTVTPPVPPGISLGGPIAYDTGYTQDTYGILAGFDVGTAFSADSALMGGILGGYVTSSMHFDQAGSHGSLDGGVVGAYATYVNGGFFIDALGKADLLTAKFTAPMLTTNSPSATAIGVVADAGYRFVLAPTWWVEPVITGQYLDASMGNLRLQPGVTADYHDNSAFYGAVGGRVGATIYTDASYMVQGSLTGRVWDDFGSNSQIALINSGPTLYLSDPFSKVWGEVIAKLDVYAPASNLNGFVSGGVDFNGQWTSVTGKVGLRMSF
jgi:hypothetical protein